MIANRVLLAILGIMLCSFFPHGAQQSDEPLPLLPSPQNLGTAPATEPAPLQISPTPTVFPPARSDRGVAQNKSPLTFSSELGSQWDRCYQELQAQDEEIKRAEEHLVQLRSQRRIRAEKLAEIAKKLAPLVSKAQEAIKAPNDLPFSNKPAALSEAEKPNSSVQRPSADERAKSKPNTTPSSGTDAILKKLESIEKGLKVLGKPPAIGKAESTSGGKLAVCAPPFSLSASAPAKAVKVVVMCKSSIPTVDGSDSMEHELSQTFIQEMQKCCAKNGEKISFVGTHRVDEYCETHPNWRVMSLTEIGKHFKADYVIRLDVKKFTLYEPGTNSQLYRGNCEIPFTVLDVQAPEEHPIYEDCYSTEFPQSRGPIDVNNGTEGAFKAVFLKIVAKELSWKFTAHLKSDEDNAE